MRIKGPFLLLFLVACGQNQGNVAQRFQAADAMVYNSAEAYPIQAEESVVLAAAVSLDEIEATTILATEGKLPSYQPVSTSTTVQQAPVQQPPVQQPPVQQPPAQQPPAQQPPAQQPPAQQPPAQQPPAQQPPAQQPPAQQPPAQQQPMLPPATQAKLASCYAQWNTLAQLKGQSFTVREYNLDVGRLRKTTIELGGNEPEVVFVNISSDTRIAKVNIGLMNPKALYCVDIEAARVINKLAVFNKCGSKIGVMEIDAGRRARNIEIREICN